MKYSLTAASLLALTSAATHQVTVGPGLSYSPESVTAATGDVVQFKFGSGHNVVSGTLAKPCENDGKIYSGDPKEGDVFSVTINGTDPIWIYCGVPHHCQGGMAMVINAPSGKTINDYKSAASGAGSSNEPSSVTGGTFGAVSSGSSSASSSAMSMASSATAAASSAASSASSAATSAASSASRAASSASAAASSSASPSSVAGNVVANVGLLAGAVLGGAAFVL